MAAPISSSDRNNLWLSWLFALLWNGITFAVLAQFLSEFHFKTAEAKHLFLLLFPLVGLGVFAWAVRTTLRWRRYGETFFLPDADAFPLGGLLKGTLQFSVSHPAPEGHTFQLTLSCVEESESGSGKDRSRSLKIVWQEIRLAEASSAKTLPVSFLLPTDAQETVPLYKATGGHGVFWRLEVKEVAESRIPFYAQYLLPVVRRELTPLERTEAEAAETTHRKEVAAYQRSAASPIVIRPCGIDDTEFHFPAGLNRDVSTTLFPICLVFAGAAYFLHRSDAPFFFAPLFGLVAVILGYCLLQLFFGSTRIVAGREGLTVTRSLLGWNRVRRLPASSITRLKTAVKMTSGTTAYHTILAVCGEKNEVSLSPSLRDPQEVEWLAAEMERQLRR